MSDETPVITGTPAPESTEISIAEYRKTRAEAPAPAASTPEVPAKTTAESETAPPEIDAEGNEAVTDSQPKPKGGFQRRIDQLTKDKRELERRLSDLETARKVEEKPTAVAAAAAAGDAKPKEADFTDYAEFIQALSRWVYRQENKAAEAKGIEDEKAEQEKTTKLRAKEKFDSYNNAIPAFEAAHADFRELLSDPGLMLPNYVQNAIIGLKEKGVEVAYQLAKEWKADPAGSTLGTILTLNEAGDFEVAMLELGAFVRSVHPTAKKSPPPPERPATRMPTPITPVSGSGGAIEADPDKMSAADYRRAREKGKLR
jgi:hypothetical protein